LRNLTGQSWSAALVFGFLLMSPAHAHAGWLAWLEDLSGPGPYAGSSFSGEAFCLGAWDYKEDKDFEARLTKVRDIKAATEKQIDALERQLNAKATADSLKVTPDDSALLLQNLKNLREALDQVLAPLDAEGPARDKDVSRQRWCFLDRSNSIASLQVDAGFFDDRGGKFESSPTYAGDTDLIRFAIVIYTPLQRLNPFQWGKSGRLNRWLRPIDLGAGLGAYILSGSTITPENGLWRAIVPLRIRAMPSEWFFPGRRDLVAQHPSDDGSGGRSRRFSQAFKVFAGFDWVLGRYNASDFTSSDVTPDLERRGEKIFTWGIEMDLGLLARAAVNR
jgi:hypothetical protein